ncbi:MAG: metal ABC transporter permease, partial [Candidatus Tectomicrobia bacterium]|nr:metal ABC transporter permease [Candidatus Tectomicrobia bacterium]
MDWLSTPLQYAFMQTGCLAAVLVGVTCATLGVHVVVRRLAFMGDALAHAVLPGLVLASLGGWDLTAGALVAGTVTALGIGWLARRQVLADDTAIGILFTSMLALGILLASLKRSFRDFSHVLFGNLLGVSWGDLLVIAVVTVLVLSVLLVLHKELELTAVDPLYAA